MRRGLLAAGLYGVLVSMSVPGLVGCSRAQDRPAAEELIYAKDDDAEVNGAIAEARKTLPVFWGKFDAAAPGYDAFSLKVGLPTSNDGEEHIWIDEIRRDGDRLEGLLANDPVDLEGLALGSKVRVTTAQISDWQYRKNGKLYGHFTTRVLMRRGNAEQRALASEMFAPHPLEPDAH